MNKQLLLPKHYPVTCHTDHVGTGSTFVAIKGLRDDGAGYITHALQKGATTIITEQTPEQANIERLCTTHNARLIIVPNARQALAEESSKQLGYPCQKLKIIGITGTKGKTTTTYLTEHILRSAGYKTAIISTIVNRILDEAESSTNTTPNSDYLQMFFAECIKRGVEYVVMEVSSHALDFYRVHGVTFAGIGFTNLAPEHMDFYATLNDYFASKARLFSHIKAEGIIVINTDNEWGIKAISIAEHYATNMHATTLSFGQQPTAKAPFAIQQTSFDGIAITLHNQTLHCPTLFGTYNCYNLTMATLLSLAANISLASIAAALKTFPGVPGRLQRHILKNGAHAFVDYAHNPSSFEQVLSTLRQHTTNLIVVFGCGGNKDTTKRPVMGKLAAAFADKVIVTDDNPRYENRQAIINEIIAGIPQEHVSKVITEPDRRKAIALAAALSQPGSIIALLGKGHETYYLIEGQTYHFDDFEEIRSF